MIKIIYKQNPLSEEKTIEQAETIGQWLTSKYEYLPEHVRIFHTSSDMDHAEISFANEVTPKNAHDLRQLDFLPGTFIVIENPKGMPALIAAIVSIVLSVAIAFLMPAPSIAQTTQNNNQSSSANNELSNRENKMRVNGRIADIYGAAWDTPDQLQFLTRSMKTTSKLSILWGVLVEATITSKALTMVKLILLILQVHR